MNNNKKTLEKIALILMFIVALLGRYFLVKNIYASSKHKPQICIDGDKEIEVEKDEKIILPIVTAKDEKDGDITSKIKVKVTSTTASKSKCRRIAKKIKKNKKILFNKIGEYTITYSVKNSSGRKTKKKISLMVVKPKKRYWIMTQYPDNSGSQGMFYTFYNEYKDFLIVIDGGNAGNTDSVRDVINAYGGHVDAWILTHYHADHVSAFNAIMKDPVDITVDNIYASPMDYKQYLEVAKWWDEPNAFTDFLNVTSDKNVTYLNSDGTFDLEDLTFTVFNSYDLNTSSYGDIPNNGSLMFKVSGCEDSILFCGDCYSSKLGEDIVKKWGDSLKSEYVQTGHHGNNSFPTSFYDVVSPKVAFFDAPEWLMKGEQYTAKDLKKYFDEKGVTVYDMTTAPNEFEFK